MLGHRLRIGALSTSPGPAVAEQRFRGETVHPGIGQLNPADGWHGRQYRAQISSLVRRQPDQPVGLLAGRDGHSATAADCVSRLGVRAGTDRDPRRAHATETPARRDEDIALTVIRFIPAPYPMSRRCPLTRHRRRNPAMTGLTGMESGRLRHRGTREDLESFARGVDGEAKPGRLCLRDLAVLFPGGGRYGPLRDCIVTVHPAKQAT